MEKGRLLHAETRLSKTIYAIFLDGHGPVLQVPVPNGWKMTGQFYMEQEKIVKV